MTDPAMYQTSTTDPKNVPKVFWWGLAIGALGFIISVSSSSSRTVNGVVTECSYTDYFPIIAAIACVGFGVTGLVKGLRAPSHRPVHPALVLALTAILAVLAVVHVMRGLGMIGGPC